MLGNGAEGPARVERDGPNATVGTDSELLVRRREDGVSVAVDRKYHSVSGEGTIVQVAPGSKCTIARWGGSIRLGVVCQGGWEGEWGDVGRANRSTSVLYVMAHRT